MITRRGALKGLGGLAGALSVPRARSVIGILGGSAQAVSQNNPLITNIGVVTYADNQQMFLNVLKQAGSNVSLSAWSTFNGSNADTNEEAYLSQILNSSGYPTTLTLSTPPTGGQQFTKLLTSALRNLTTPPTATAPYPPGNYRFGFQGKFTATIGGDFTVPAQSAPSGVTISGNQITSTNPLGTTSYVTLNCATATTGGLQITVTAVPDSVNPPAIWSVVQSAYTTQFDAGQIFHPNWLAWLQTVPWKALRFMDTLQMNTQVVNFSFAANPAAGSALPALSTAWAGYSGQRRVTLSTGEELQVTFTPGSTAVTSTTNPTVSATSTGAWYFAYDSWAGRPKVTDLTYATNKGVPFEVLISLCMTLGCMPWLNVPPQFQTADWGSLASLVVSNLTGGRKAFIEWVNETWNGGFQAYHWITAKSIFKWGGGGDPGSYIGMETALLADQLATTAGNPGFDNNFIVLMAGQAAGAGWLTSELKATSWTGNTPPWQRTSASGQKTIKGVCIAPYAGNGPIYAADFTHMTGEGDGGYSDFFATFTQNPVGGYTYHDNSGNPLPSSGWYGIASTWVTNTVSAIAPYGALPIYCYEGSWQFDANGASGQATFLMNAARDSRMANLQQIYYRQMAAAGCTPAQYNTCAPYTNSSGVAGTYEWGLIESVMQTEGPLTSTPARWQGAVNYVNNG